MLVMLPGSGFFTSSHTGGAFLHQTDFGKPVVVVIEEEEGKVVEGRRILYQKQHGDRMI